MIYLKNNTNKVTFLLIILFIVSTYIFYSIKQNNHLLNTRKWHSNIEIDFANTGKKSPFAEQKNLKKIEINGDFKYFNDKTYFQDVSINIYNNSDTIIYSALFSISGTWSYLQGYLFFQTKKIDTVDIDNDDSITDKVKVFLRDLAIKRLQDTKYIEPIDQQTLLMISVDNSTSIWTAVKDI